MNESAVRAFNAINREFYAQTADQFDESRGRFWPGWERLIETITAGHSKPSADPPMPPSVLDLGCGNGRFGRFLAKRWTPRLHYTGVDNSSDLLEHARIDLSALPDIQTDWITADLVEGLSGLQSTLLQPTLTNKQYDLVAVLGVLHHVPSVDNRLALIRFAAERVKRGGTLVFTAWCFDEQPRFRDRYVEFPSELAAHAEAGDHLLDWRRGFESNAVLRYCHYIDQDEQDHLCAASGLREVARYKADGVTGQGNRYSVLIAHGVDVEARIL